jgi:basic membrane protein A
MVKRVDEAVFDAVQLVQQGRFQGGVRVLGLKERGVDYVYDARNKALIPDAARARVELLRDSIIAGHIRVPSTR